MYFTQKIHVHSQKTICTSQYTHLERKSASRKHIYQYKLRLNNALIFQSIYIQDRPDILKYNLKNNNNSSIKIGSNRLD